jgi:hypothetical protein
MSTQFISHSWAQQQFARFSFGCAVFESTGLANSTVKSAVPSRDSRSIRCQRTERADRRISCFLIGCNRRSFQSKWECAHCGEHVLGCALLARQRRARLPKPQWRKEREIVATSAKARPRAAPLVASGTTRGGRAGCRWGRLPASACARRSRAAAGRGNPASVGRPRLRPDPARCQIVDALALMAA